MAFSISEISSALTGEGARPTLFNVSIAVAPWISADVSSKLTFTCQSTSIPAATIDSISVPYFGRKIKVAGDRTYSDWAITVINDEDFLVRNAFERWNHAMNSPEGNLRSDGATASPVSYKAQGEVNQFGKEGDIIKKYQFQGVFPKEIGSIDVGWDNNNAIETFSVTFSVDLWIAV